MSETTWHRDFSRRAAVSGKKVAYQTCSVNALYLHTPIAHANI